MLDDARVVAGRKAIATCALGECEQLVEAERAVAADARVRRLAVRVAVEEGRHDRAAELLAQVERHVRDAEPVARLARGDDGLGRTARALRVRAGGIEPEAQRHADRVRQRAQKRNGAVDTAAHRNGRASRLRLRAEDRTERIRERIRRERVARNRSGLEQREPLEPGHVGLDDAVAVDDDANSSPLAVARRVSETLDESRPYQVPDFRPLRAVLERPVPGTGEHKKLGPDLGNLSKQVGTLPPRRRTRVPFMVLLVHHSARTQLPS